MSRRILASAELTIELGRIVDNYRRLGGWAGAADVAGMVKSDGYGLGAVPVSEALVAAGCRTLFVAQASEGVELRQALEGDQRASVDIYVLNGAHPGTEDALVEHRLLPVLNSLEQIDRWVDRRRSSERSLRAAVHLDTGMHRLGLPVEEARRLAAEPWRLADLEIDLVMSHLASADDPASGRNADQLRLFVELTRPYADHRLSLANSSGIHLGPEFHFDLVRPGYALYGGNPIPGRSNPMSPVVTLEAPVLQVRPVAAGDTVGYGATHRVLRAGRVATLGLGYGDGFPRALSGLGQARLGVHTVPVVGRISMDLATVDVTDVPESELWLGRPVELIGRHRLLDDVAHEAGTIGYELLTDLGSRYRRRYRTD
jgi:alanine racemase